MRRHGSATSGATADIGALGAAARGGGGVPGGTAVITRAGAGGVDDIDWP
ncbi:hypothetical protein POF50_029145 [Streptomyces sp. SL13]|uniref:Uncharacterized protein n=1 Tax=Streptantibioticus silvisoli TaxID=2705255 RepID=A0AA90KB97_9ACTN|nr:hypothetical protein [Streptantibioticus silvisoli]MDI5973363.1 hypothetical protein [Streptantibioticus silvisoli]